ncbi:helix-turn-helix transcriptional regulator (plasmid) [Streptomyces sp. BI20]|uniref:helix-turn-helix transcriptional regulator n=1 Tax=Streptomyces sp. BI20 TaxID=3403460 RepID=UPI003C746B7E
MRVTRLLRMALLIQSAPGLTAAALAREFEVSERTVIRDVQSLQDAGIPIRAERGRLGGYHLAPGHRTRLTTLHPTEAETLYLSGLPTALRDLGLSDAAGAARLKLSATLLPSVRAAAESSERRFHLDAPAWFREPATPEVLPELARAVWGDRALALGYARPARDGAPPRTVTRTAHPHGLVLKAGVWYVVCRVPDDGARGDGPGWRTYRVDRITTIRELDPSDAPDAVFTREPGFDLAAHWEARAAEFARALLRETATVRLTARGLRLLPTAADPAGLPEALASASAPDPAGRVVLDLPVESAEVAFAQLVGLGAEVEVLAPPELRGRFREHARALAALYAPEGRAEPQR